MSRKSKSRPLGRAISAICEALEERTLLSSPWAPQEKAIGLDKARANYPSVLGQGEAIAVIDTGVDYLSPELGGAFGPGHTVEAGWNFINNNGNPYPPVSNAHGTGVADEIANSDYTYEGLQYEGIAPDVKIIALAENNTYEVQDALNWVIANRTKYNIVGVNIVDFGGGPWNQYVSELNTLVSDHVYIGVPAGNSGSTATAPIANGVVQIGSVSPSNLDLSYFSNRGQYVPIMAPGEEMTLPYINSNNGDQCIVTGASGTSWTSPQVVATAALVRQILPNDTDAQITQIIEQSGTPTSSGGMTYKVVNVNAAIALAYQDAKGTSTPAPAPTPPPAPKPAPTPTPTPKPTPTPTPTPKPTPAPTPTATPESPFSGTPIPVPGVIQAEDFDNGGQGVAYHTNTSTNNGGVFRNTGVGIQATSDTGGGYNVGWIVAGEWLNYTVNVSATGTYTLETRLASTVNGGKFHIVVDGVAATGEISVPDTGGNQDWTTVTTTGVKLTAGKHVIRIVFDDAGPGGYVGNFNWMQFVKPATTPASTTTTTPPKPPTTPAPSSAQLEEEIRKQRQALKARRERRARKLDKRRT